MRPLSMAAFFPLLSACLTGEVYHRPELRVEADGPITKLGGCTYIFDECVSPFEATPLMPNTAVIPPFTREFRMVLIPADPAIGVTALWACGADGRVAAAVVGGDVARAPFVAVPMVLGGPVREDYRHGNARVPDPLAGARAACAR